MEDDALLLMQPPYDITEFRPQDALQRPGFGPDYMDIEHAVAQRGRHLKADEAGADHQGTLRRRGRGNDRLAVAEGTQIVHDGWIGAGQIQPHGIGARGKQERAILERLAIGERDAAVALSTAVTRALRRRSMTRFS